MRKNFDLSVYFIADPDACLGRSVVDVVEQAVAGGATMVQLRNKQGNITEFLAQAKELKKRLGNRVPLVINDRVDVALAANADGVHLGQEDFPPAEARRMIGPDKIIGVTAFTPEHFKAIDPRVVDYAGAGPYFPTFAKPGKPVLGPENFRALVAISPVPVVAIGGITAVDVPGILRNGAAGVAMMRAISKSMDPAQAARDFVAGFQPKAHRKAS